MGMKSPEEAMDSAGAAPVLIAMPAPLPGFGSRLRRLRRLKGWKQDSIAALAGVNQATVSRWEAGNITPSEDLMHFLMQSLSQTPVRDAALQRLVEACTLPVHLVTDLDHVLLAASRSKQLQWGQPVSDLLHTSLWRFATEDIARAETQLQAQGWWSRDIPDPVVVQLTTAQTRGLHIRAGTMVWARLLLADGTPARLCTVLEHHA
ncbi:MAG: transcriptional regulator [Burkholderiales bacterium PBB4]|nr:MAG: transcriptional regulator [Burkholderiales bacterium PBB4]